MSDLCSLAPLIAVITKKQELGLIKLAYSISARVTPPPVCFCVFVFFKEPAQPSGSVQGEACGADPGPPWKRYWVRG